jgi:hypothetical protein
MASKIRFVIDRFHWSNHVTCNPLFNPNMHTDMNGMNTEVCEQLFSWLRPYGDMLQFMRTDHYFKMVKFLIHQHNASVRAKILVAAQHAAQAQGGL